VSAVPADDGEPILGSTLPRVYTQPLVTGPPGPCGCGCALDETTSYGFDVVWFAANILGTPLDPWERWLVIHAGELLPDGRPRFRTVLAIVARQNGKSLLMRVLILFWMFVERLPMILATSTDRSYAKAAWTATCDAARENEHLSADLDPKRCQTLQIGEEEFRTIHGSKYRFAAVNRRAGRSLTIHRLVLDEIREHANFDAWGAATNAMNAVPSGQIFTVSNQGDDQSIVLDWLRGAALTFLETGQGDRRLGLFEWSAPPGSEPTDIQALCAANPNAGHRLDIESLLGAAKQAISGGGEALTTFKTEVMCMRVDKLDPAIEPGAWDVAGTDAPIDLAEHRRNVALCVDVALDGSHASLVAAALLDGTVHAEVVRHWEGRGCTQQLRADLPSVVARVKPGVVGWFPMGPAASVAAELAERKGRSWPPPYVKVAEIRGEVTAVCMGLAELVLAGEIRHPNDDMLTMHVKAAEKLRRGDAWVFGRQGAGAIDGAYALAGAVHLARTMAARPKPRVVTRKDRGRLHPV
jgi:hypothetical protein